MKSGLWRPWEFWEDASGSLRVFTSLLTLPLTPASDSRGVCAAASCGSVWGTTCSSVVTLSLWSDFLWFLLDNQDGGRALRRGLQAALTEPLASGISRGPSWHGGRARQSWWRQPSLVKDKVANFTGPSKQKNRSYKTLGQCGQSLVNGEGRSKVCVDVGLGRNRWHPIGQREELRFGFRWALPCSDGLLPGWPVSYKIVMKASIHTCTHTKSLVYL